MKEVPAKGSKGFLLYSPFTKRHFFRIYEEDGEFKDYDIRAEEVEIEITSEWVSLYEDKILDFNSKALGRTPKIDVNPELLGLPKCKKSSEEK